MPGIRIIHQGLIEYGRARQLQKDLVAEVQQGADPAIILCEHPKTVTLGRSYHQDNILVSVEELMLRGITVVSADRGGDVTLHAPGQLVAYPIMDLRPMGRDIGAYLRKLEQTCVDFLRDFDIVAQGDDGRRGVWVGRAKIASIGVGVSRWITYHGIGINISTDLGLFKVIRPCGLDVRMTSVERLKGTAPAMPAAAAMLADHCVRVFGGKGHSS